MNKFGKLLALSVFGIASQAAIGSDGQINFTGAVTNATCSISSSVGGSSGGSTFAVALPTISTGALATAGDSAGATRFDLILNNCTTGSTPSASTTVGVYFEAGSTVNPTTNNLKNTTASGSGGATNVELQLLNANSPTPIAIGAALATQNPVLTNLPATGPVTLNYIARYYRPSSAGAVTAGTFTTNVTYSLAYQ